MAIQTTESSDKASKKRSGSERSIGGVANEFKDLAVAYAKQETLDPLKSLGRFVAWGLVGAILISLGTGLVVLAGVRAVQAETGSHLSGSLTWVPYTGGLILALVVAGAAVTAIAKGGRPR